MAISTTGNAVALPTDSTPDQAESFAAPRGAIRYACLLLLILPWSVDGGRILYQGIETALTPVPTCLTELHIVHGMQQVAAGDPLYPSTAGLPYTFHLYNPLTYLPAGWAAGWLELDLDQLLVAGRILPLISTFALLLVLGYFVKRQTNDYWAALVCILMVLFYHSSTLTDFFRNRPETPGLLLTISGWMVVQLRPKWWVWLSALLFVAAIAFKPVFLAAPVACGLQLLWQRDRKSFAQLTLTSLLLGSSMILATYLWLGHGYFQHTVAAMSACPMNPWLASLAFYPILTHGHWGMLLPATMVSVAWLAAKGSQTNLVLYLLTCFALTSLAHGKQGADLNYHAELSLLMVLTVVTGLWQMFQRGTVLAWAPLLLMLLGTWMPIYEFGAGWNELSHRRIDRVPFAYQGPPSSPAAEQAQGYQRFRGQALILDDAVAVRVGDPVVYDWYALRILFNVGHLDFDDLSIAVQQRRYAVIVIPSYATDKWSTALQAVALDSGYRRAVAENGLIEFWR